MLDRFQGDSWRSQGMIVFEKAPIRQGIANLLVTAGCDLDDALAQFGTIEDCLGCSTATAAPGWTPAASIARITRTFTPLSDSGQIVRPETRASAMLRRGSYWTDVDVDAGAQRLRTVRLPSELAGAQRLIAVNDLSGDLAIRPTVALGIWALFAHPILRMGARFAGARDGLTAEIALAVHPDRYLIVERDPKNAVTIVLATQDPIVADLMVLALRQGRARTRGVGPWEDPLIQAATELDLGARNSDTIEISAIVSPTLSSAQHERAVAMLQAAAELIGVRSEA